VELGSNNISQGGDEAQRSRWTFCEVVNFALDQMLILVKLVEKWIGDCKTYGVKSVPLKL
jgi:hypothetical protein